jgi:hypothetical protein
MSDGEIPVFPSHGLMFMPPHRHQVILRYLPFGAADHDLFLVHQVGPRPSFDPVLRIAADRVNLTEAEIARQLR